MVSDRGPAALDPREVRRLTPAPQTRLRNARPGDRRRAEPQRLVLFRIHTLDPGAVALASARRRARPGGMRSVDGWRRRRNVHAGESLASRMPGVRTANAARRSHLPGKI